MSNLHYPGYADDPKSFWEQTDEEYAHLGTINHEQLWGDWEREFIPKYQWEGAQVIDYGCGGGWLGKLLIEKYGIGGYWGVDISERSRAFAVKNVPRAQIFSPDEYERLSAKMVTRWPSDRAIFVSLNVIHHQPTLSAVRDIEMAAWGAYADTWIMTIRNIGKPTYFQPNNPGNAFWTEPQYMRGLLADDWELQWKSAIEPAPAHRQYLGFKRRED